MRPPLAVEPAHQHVVGPDCDAVGILGDASHRLRQVDRIAELGRDGPMDGTHSADGTGILGRILDAEHEARPARRGHLVEDEQQRNL